VDCLTEEYAIEMDFGGKWAEAIGQSLSYAAMTGKKAGIVLIVGKKGDRYIARIQKIIDVHSLDIRL